MDATPAAMRRALDEERKPLQIDVDVPGDVLEEIARYMCFYYNYRHKDSAAFTKDPDDDIPEFQVDPAIAGEVYFASKVTEAALPVIYQRL